MRMRPLAAIDIPAGQTGTLSPGGMHIMLLGLTQPLREGQSFPLTLSFDHAGPRQVTVAIEKAGAMGSARCEPSLLSVFSDWAWLSYNSMPSRAGRYGGQTEHAAPFLTRNPSDLLSLLDGNRPARHLFL